MTRRGQVLSALAALALAPAAALALWIVWPLPRALTAPPAAPSLTLEDRNGIVLRSTRAADGSLARWLPLAEMDPQLIQAFVAVEDRRFYSHAGVDGRAVLRALLDDLRGSRVVSGASTITMQLARLLHPSAHDLSGKFSQALWAVRLERHLTKQQILEQYLNRVPLGQAANGVEAASRVYFDASATRLSLGQASLLVGLASAPSADNPFVDAVRARAMRARALDRMVSLGYTGRDAAQRAAAEPVMVTRHTRPFLAPHFTSRVLQWAADSQLASGGTWRTSLDLPLQQALEGEVRHTVVTLSDRGVAQAAVVVLDNVTGEVLAWVGSPDFWADTAGQVDMVISPRQPGSALKPFLYGLAFDRGYSPASVIADVPRVYQTAIGPYQPRNYDRRWHGPVRAREALASSFNLPALELTDRLGAGSLLRVLQTAGFTTLDRGADHYGIGLALGNGDVTLLELANAYRALARGGALAPVRWRQARLESPAAAGGARIVSPGAAALVLDILSDPIARVPGFGLDTPFDFPFPVAVKTGTSHRFTDNWAVGVTAAFTVAVWAGNFSGRPMRQVSGVTGAGPLLHRAIMDVARLRAPGVLTSPAEAGAVRVAVCKLSGLRAGRFCPATVEWVLPATQIGRCDWHPGAGRVVYPAEYAEWVSQHPADTVITLAGDAGARLPFRIVSPQDGDRYRVPPGVDARYATIALRAVGSPGAVQWSVDGRPLESESWRLEPGTHRIEATAGAGLSARVTIAVR